MSSRVRNFFSSIKTYYNGINGTTMSGAMDVIVIQQPDGSLKSTPFYVRFGIVKILRPSLMNVDITVNNELVKDMKMKLSPSGEAYFEIENDSTLGADDDDDNDAVEAEESLTDVESNTNALKEISIFISQNDPKPTTDDSMLKIVVSGIGTEEITVGSTMVDVPSAPALHFHHHHQHQYHHHHHDSSLPTTSRSWLSMSRSTSRASDDMEAGLTVSSSLERKEWHASCDNVLLHRPSSTNDVSTLSTSINSESDDPNNLVSIVGKQTNLTSDQLKKLNLHYGENEVYFTITTRFQGTSLCRCFVYLWDHTDQLVISDVDGTVTKSDVLGSLFSLVGPYWAHHGITKLYQRICDNGYKMVYLSARSIGQADGTRNYLRHLKQENYPMPSGPVLLSPNSVYDSFHREFIAKTPQQFKIACLRELASLFPSSCNPLYAGFGNKPTDVDAYQTVGVDSERIFTINTKSQLQHDSTVDPKVDSYTALEGILDTIFPARGAFSRLDVEEYPELTDWNVIVDHAR